MNYEKGIQSLPVAILNDSEVVDAIRDILDSLRDERRYGGTENTRSKRARAVDILNRKMIHYDGRSFNDLCG